MYTATKEFRFEAGHCLDQHPGKCKNAHGHNYSVLVTLESCILDDLDMVKDFYKISEFAKPLFESFDHAFIINKDAKDKFELDLYDLLRKHSRKIVELPFRATAENMAKYFYDELNSKIDRKDHYRVSKITVYETPTSFATYGD